MLFSILFIILVLLVLFALFANKLLRRSKENHKKLREVQEVEEFICDRASKGENNDLISDDNIYECVESGKKDSKD